MLRKYPKEKLGFTISPQVCFSLILLQDPVDHWTLSFSQICCTHKSNPLVRISASILNFICTVDQFSLPHGQHLRPNYLHLSFLPGLLLGLPAFMLIPHYLPSNAYFPCIVRVTVLDIKSDYITLPLSSCCTWNRFCTLHVSKALEDLTLQTSAATTFLLTCNYCTLACLQNARLVFSLGLVRNLDLLL